MHHTHSRRAISRRWPWLLLVACGAPPELPLGQLELDLSAGDANRGYRLSRATFDITGEHSLTVNSEQEPAAIALSLSLPIGQYSILLQPGWEVLQFARGEEAPVTAALVSDNPLPFSIEQGDRTPVLFRFSTVGSTEPEAASGQLEIGVEVDNQRGAQVHFTEIMRNPSIVADTQGEWIELFNSGNSEFNLSGCVLARGESKFSFATGVSVPAQGFVVLSNGAAPGFVPDAVYTGVALPNTGDLDLTVTCAGQVLDRVTLAADQLPDSSGVSLSLDPRSIASPDGITTEHWCAAPQSFSSDKGSPGAVNPPCPDVAGAG